MAAHAAAEQLLKLMLDLSGTSSSAQLTERCKREAIPCPLCNKLFNSELGYHLFSCHEDTYQGLGDFSWTVAEWSEPACPLCNLTISKTSELVEHLIEDHFVTLFASYMLHERLTDIISSQPPKPSCTSACFGSKHSAGPPLATIYNDLVQQEDAHWDLVLAVGSDVQRIIERSIPFKSNSLTCRCAGHGSGRGCGKVPRLHLPWHVIHHHARHLTERQLQHVRTETERPSDTMNEDIKPSLPSPKPVDVNFSASPIKPALKKTSRPQELPDDVPTSPEQGPSIPPQDPIEYEVLSELSSISSILPHPAAGRRATHGQVTRESSSSWGGSQHGRAAVRGEDVIIATDSRSSRSSSMSDLTRPSKSSNTSREPVDHEALSDLSSISSIIPTPAAAGRRGRGLAHCHVTSESSSTRQEGSEHGHSAAVQPEGLIITETCGRSDTSSDSLPHAAVQEGSTSSLSSPLQTAGGNTRQVMWFENNTFRTSGRSSRGSAGSTTRLFAS